MSRLARFFRMQAKTLLLVCVFFTAGFLTYGSSLGNDFVSWDDIGLIQENADVASFSWKSVRHVFSSYDPELYIPLTFVSYQIDHIIAGYQPWMYHLTNLILHVLNALLVVWILSFFFISGWMAVALGALFLLHPLNTEAVAWASARKDVLSTFFFLSSLVAYLRYRSGGTGLSYAVCLGLFLLGLFSKVMVVTLPVVLIASDLLERRKFDRRVWVEKIPFFLFAGVFFVVALYGKTSVLAQSTPWEKLLMSFKSTVFYLQKFLVPTGLSFAYPYTKSITILSFDFGGSLAVIALVLAAYWFWGRRNHLLGFGLAFYVLTLVPTFANFSKGNDLYFASDRYAYIPMIGLLIATGSLVEAYFSRQLALGKASSRLTGAICTITSVLVVAGVLSNAQSKVWSSSFSLYASALEHYPNSRAAHHNLGMEYLKTGDPEKAVSEFDAAEKIKDDPRTHVSRGAAYVALNKLSEAEAEYRKVIGIDPDEPDSYYGLGNIARRRGDLKAAIGYYVQALSVRPDYANALNNLGAVYIELGDWNNAIEVLRRSVAIRPDFPESYYNLAGAEERAKLLKEAEDDYKIAIMLHPGDADALASLANLLYNQKRIPEAAEYLKEALAVNQDNEIGLRLLQRMQKDGIVR